MFTDMVGYSALSQRNEALALELLDEHREVLRSVFPRHQGNEIKSTGDGFLVEFPSALAAVQCATEIQHLMRKRNESRSPERRVLIRIGIHLGDVVRRENDVFGDGVNIAARIEPLAEPGGICVSRAVYEQIENKVDHALVQLSRPALKNIQATVEVYRLLLDETRVMRPPARRKGRPRTAVWIAVAALLVVGLGLLAVRFAPGFRHPAAQMAPSVPVAPPSPTAPPAAVVPPVRADFHLLHSVGPTNLDGVNPWGPLVRCSDGMLAGTSVNRGPGGGGAVFRLDTNGAGYRVLMPLGVAAGAAEPTGGLIEGRDGVLYGTTFRGGNADAGTVFRIARDGTGFRVLHAFAPTNDCRNPQAELLEGSDGALYGTTTSGGGHGRGGVFRLGKDGSGYSILTGFYRGGADDPRRPVGGLIQASDGSLLGTTKSGGAKDNGTVFRLVASGAVTVIKSLGIVPGGLMQPEGTLVLASDGFLLGTCVLGGVAGHGGIFRVAPDGSSFSILHSFGTAVDDGRQPSTGLTPAGDGSLLGTCMAGGSADLGILFRIERDGTGYQVLHHFTGGAADGGRPRSRLIPGIPGEFFGATLNGGTGNLGAVYRLVLGGSGNGAL